MENQPTWVEGIRGDFPLHQAVIDALPDGVKVISADVGGMSAWTNTARLLVLLPDESLQSYFLKCATGQGAEALAWGEHHSATAMTKAVPNLCPSPIGKGKYDDGSTIVFFYLQVYYDMDVGEPPDPVDFIALTIALHQNGTSPNGMFGYPVGTTCGIMERTPIWDKSWARCFTHQLKDVIRYDNEANGERPEFELASAQLIDHVIPRLLGALQSDGREITPTLTHGDLWEGNVGIDRETGNIIIFDPGCTYAHNEVEFGTWRCSWSSHFSLPIYMRLYQREIGPSEPVEEWDDRNRLYAIRANLNDAAGHPGSHSRIIAYNDMLYLCEKYAPLDTLEKYNPEVDISVTGIRGNYDVMAGARKG